MNIGYLQDDTFIHLLESEKGILFVCFFVKYLYLVNFVLA